MPAATPLPLRSGVLELAGEGLDSEQIALRLGLAARTVRDLLARARSLPQGHDLSPLFHNCGRRLDPARLSVLESCLQLRRLHQGWGAGRIRLDLLEMHPKALVPPTRTLSRWLRQAGLTPPPAVVVEPHDARRASEPHEVWQMDAVECLRLADGSGACWLRHTDEYSGAILATEIFPQYRWAKVAAACVQAALRKVFRRWGCPGWLRVDNGIPWGTASGLPSELSLWLAGLGVWTHWNDPYQPQQNGVVERSQGTTQRWVDAAGCGDIDGLRRRVEHEDKIQRQVYPSVGGRSRSQAYPGLVHTGRGYCEGWEKYVWDVHEALRWLGRYRVRRKVSRRGQVSLYHRLIQVSPEYGGEWVYVQMDAQRLEWVISDAQGKELRRRPAPQFTAEAIIALDVARP